MAFCTNCGSRIPGSFCTACGAPAPPSTAPDYQARPEPPAGPIRGENIVSALCYTMFVIPGLVILFIRPYSRSKLVRFHALQSILVGFSLYLANVFLTDAYPFWEYTFTPVRVYHAVAMILWGCLLVVTLINRRMVVPVLGQLAEKLA